MLKVSGKGESAKLMRVFCIRHFHIPHNTPCLPPKNLNNLCFHFWLLHSSKEKLKTMLMQNFGGKQGVLWGMMKWRMSEHSWVNNAVSTRLSNREEHKRKSHRVCIRDREPSKIPSRKIREFVYARLVSCRPKIKPEWTQMCTQLTLWQSTVILVIQRLHECNSHTRNLGIKLAALHAC